MRNRKKKVGNRKKWFGTGENGPDRKNNKIYRAWKPRPYFDKNKKAANNPECPLCSKCQGRAGSPRPSTM